MSYDAPLVSVITPVYNRVHSLPMSLDSVAAQSYPNIEHIVVDGGSTDGSVDVLEERAARGDLRFVSERDGGMYEAINKGLRLAHGDVLAYVNSDDLYMPWTIEVAVDTLRQGADLAYGDLVRVVRNPGGASTVSLQFYRPFDLNHYTHVGALAQPTVVWSRNVYDQLGGFDESYRLLGDCEYWLRAATAGKRLQYLAEVQAVQVDHDQTLRVTQEPRMREEFRRLRSDYRSAAGPPRDAKLEHISRSLRWRWNQWLLRREMTRPQPQRWPRFIAFLREQGIDANLRDLLAFQLPERLRPASLTWLDAAGFETGLARAIDAATET